MLVVLNVQLKLTYLGLVIYLRWEKVLFYQGMLLVEFAFDHSRNIFNS